MNRFLNRGPNRVKKPYDRENLKKAYQANLSGVTVYRASRIYNVPESTLRDSTRHNVELDCTPGPNRIFTFEEEKNLVDHITFMGNIGYGYSVTDIRYMAADYGKSLGKSVKAKEGLSTDWFYSFMNRWENLKTAKPQKLGLARAKTASKETIDQYFEDLKNIMMNHDLMNAPERIWNVDESGFSTEHSPPKIVCARDTKPQAVTSPRSKNVTLVGGINALGNHVPPFYIFPGKRWNDSFLAGAVAGSVGRMTDSGWINKGVFEDFVTTHLARYVGLEKGAVRPATLLLYDGHKSHLSLTLNAWAKERNVILYVLPPHSSHLTQPLDVGVFGPMKLYYNRECRSYMHINPGMSVTIHEVAGFTAKPFNKAFSTETIVSAFRKSGIYPFDAHQITEVQTAPASIYPSEEKETMQDEQTTNKPCNEITPDPSISFLERRTITKVVQRPKKKFTPPIKISGNLLSEPNMTTLQKQQLKKEQVPVKKTKPSRSTPSSKPSASPRPSTSGLSGNKGKLLPVESSDTSSDSDETDDDPCCVCKKSSPPQLRGCSSIVFVKWGQCDVCGHWVHLSFCTEIRVLRRDSFFRRPHCPEE